MDREAWHAAIRGVAKSRTQLRDEVNWTDSSGREDRVLKVLAYSILCMAKEWSHSFLLLHNCLSISFWHRCTENQDFHNRIMRFTTKARNKLVNGWNCFVCIWLCENCCSVTQSCPTLCHPMDCSMPGFSVLLLKAGQTHDHWVGDAIQPSHPLWSPWGRNARQSV